MLRSLFLALAFCVAAPCFADEMQDLVKKIETTGNGGIAITYGGSGCSHLLLNRYSLALEDFQHASEIAKGFRERMPGLEMFINFGKIIACDALGMQKECEQAIGALVLLVNEFDLDDDSDDDSDEMDSETEKFVKMWMHKLASLAPTPNVRKLLTSFVDEAL